MLSVLSPGSRFRDLEEYLLLTENFLAGEQAAFVQEVDAAVEAAGLKGEDREDYYSFKEDDYARLHDAFPRIVYSSTLLTACSLFESSFVDVCRQFERDGRLATATSWAQTSGKGVRKAAAFLRDNFGLDPARDPRWQEVLDIYRVRDCFAHANGDVSLMRPPQQQELDAAAGRFASAGVGISSARQLEVGPPFVRLVLSRFTALWSAFVDATRDNAVLGPRYWP